jgi:hypothetical protein
MIEALTTGGVGFQRRCAFGLPSFDIMESL